jgi:EKC/KEOPS complex subunit PCC1/LAGE3
MLTVSFSSSLINISPLILSFNHSVIDLPLPTERLAISALRALQVDKELSSLVHREFSVVSPSPANSNDDVSFVQSQEKTVLRTEYKATTNRMLRVAVNGFMESLTVVLGVMEELDVDVLEGQAPA